MTINIFLNDLNTDQGGETIFYDDTAPKEPVLSFPPKAGTGVIFDREILHTGNQVKYGEKYLFRTDIMM
jgi:hypothetical protein